MTRRTWIEPCLPGEFIVMQTYGIDPPMQWEVGYRNGDADLVWDIDSLTEEDVQWYRDLFHECGLQEVAVVRQGWYCHKTRRSHPPRIVPVQR